MRRRERRLYISRLALAILVAFLLIIVTPSCAPAPVARSSSSGRVFLAVKNENWLDAHVYLVRGGGAARKIGIAKALETSVFLLGPEALGTPFVLYARLQMSEDKYHSEDVTVSAGEYIEWVLPAGRNATFLRRRFTT